MKSSVSAGSSKPVSSSHFDAADNPHPAQSALPHGEADQTAAKSATGITAESVDKNVEGSADKSAEESTTGNTAENAKKNADKSAEESADQNADKDPEENAAKIAEKSLRGDELSSSERAMLEFEKRFWRRNSAKEEIIRSKFGLTPMRYYQQLNVLIRRPEALKAYPSTVSRLLRLAEKRFGDDATTTSETSTEAWTPSQR